LYEKLPAKQDLFFFSLSWSMFLCVVLMLFVIRLRFQFKHVIENLDLF